MAWLAPIAAVGIQKATEKEDPSLEIWKDQGGRLSQLIEPDLDAYAFNPEQYQYETVAEDPTLQLRQRALLEQMQKLGETGLSDADKASYQANTNNANKEAGQRSAALMNEMRARGQGGSGLEFALREQAGQEALTRAAASGNQQAGDSARQRALYQQAYGDALGQQRQQDYTTQANNTNVINEFNKLNTSQRNDANLANMQRKNDVKQQQYENSLSKITGQANAAGQIAKAGANAAASSNALTANALGQASAGLMGSAGYGPYANAGKTTDTDEKIRRQQLVAND